MVKARIKRIYYESSFTKVTEDKYNESRIIRIMNNKLFRIVFVIIIFFSIFFIYKIFFYHEKRIEKLITCEDLLDGFDDALKEVAVNDHRKNCVNSGEPISRANRYWREYMDADKVGRCTIFRSVRYFDKKAFLVTQAIGKAEEIFLEKNPENACQLALSARADFVQLKKDNKRLDISAEIFTLFKEIDKLEKAGKKAEVMQILPDLKYQFTLLKQYGPDENYLRIIVGMETAIGRLDKFLDGPDFQKAKSDLITLFWEMYYRY